MREVRYQAAPDPVVVTEPVVVASPLYRFSFSPIGARLVGAELLEYRSFAAGDEGMAQLIPEASGFLSYRLIFGPERVPVEPVKAKLSFVFREDKLGICH